MSKKREFAVIVDTGKIYIEEKVVGNE